MRTAVRSWALLAVVAAVALAVHALPFLLVRSRAHLLVGAGVVAIVVLVAWHLGLARVLLRAHNERRR
jgi:hypothetical protein